MVYVSANIAGVSLGTQVVVLVAEAVERGWRSGASGRPRAIRPALGYGFSHTAQTRCLSTQQDRSGILNSMTWLFWALLSAVFAAATALLAKVGVEGIDSNLATAIRTTVVLVFTWAIAIGLEKHHAIQQIGRRSWIFLVLSGICTGLSWLCYFRALQLGPASSVAPIDKLSVVLVVLGAWLFLDEHMSPLKIGGVSLIAIGAVMLAFA